CGAWNTLVETVATPAATRFHAVAGAVGEVRQLSTVEARVDPRSPTGLEEFDRVLGGGLVPGAVVLLGGDPGIGKSTLLLQAMAAIGAAKRTLYVTGEESAEQIAMRARRLGLVNAPVDLQAEVQLEAIVAAIRMRQPEVVVIDSIQTVYTEALESAPGSVAQVRECAAQLTRLAKQSGSTVILVGHVTKEGARPLLVEVQALVDPVQGGLARRVAVGLDPQRLALLLAVLHRHGGVETGAFDVFVNAVGGVRIGEPAADLAIIAAVYSSCKNI